MPRTPRTPREMPPGLPRLLGRICAALAVIAALGALLLSRVEAHARADLEAFDSAPVCAGPVSPDATHSCQAIESATVDGVTGTVGKNPTTTARLRLPGGALLDATVRERWTLGIGDPAVVTIWRGQAVRVAFEGDPALATFDNPGWQAGNLAIALVVLLGVMVALASGAAFSLTYFTIERARMVPAYLLGVASVFFAGLLRALNAYGVLVVVVWIVPLWVLGVYVMWPRTAWARTRSEWSAS